MIDRLPAQEGSRMLTRLVTGVATIVAACVAMANSATAEFRVCNKSSEQINVVFGYHEQGSDWVAAGWWIINVGDCALIHGPIVNPYFYLYGEGVNGSIWSGDKAADGSNFCIARQGFKLLRKAYGHVNGYEDCQRHKLESKRFFRVDAGNNIQWTHTLYAGPAHSGQGVPRPPPPPPPIQPTPTRPPSGGTACERFPNLC
jgi:uncharacterized membrane protein